MSTGPQHHQQSQIPPLAPPPFTERQPPAIRLYPLSNYTFGTKETQPEEDPSVKDRLRRLEEHYEQYGMRRTCEGVLVCHEHNHPHVLMLQIANAFFKLCVPFSQHPQQRICLSPTADEICCRPGDYLPPTSAEIPGFKARLNERLAPTGSLSTADPADTDWDIFDSLATWWRPNFETFMYPYLPPHVTRPKECKKLYFIQLPASKVLSVPKNMKLLAVPLFELYDNTGRYGPQLSAIPHYLSRYRWEFVDEKGEVVAWTPGTKVDPNVKTKVLAGGEANGAGEDDRMNGIEGEAGEGAEIQAQGF